MPRRKVFFYVQGRPPLSSGTGPSRRYYSNLQAYADIGRTVEVVYFQTHKQRPLPVNEVTGDVRYLTVDVTQRSLRFWSPRRQLRALAGFLGFPFSNALDAEFPTRPRVRAEVLRRHRSWPSALHHFEFLVTASACLGVSGIRTIWSFNDIESSYLRESQLFLADNEHRLLSRHDKRRVRLYEKAERRVAENSSLVLCISATEREILRRDWSCSRAEVLPICAPREEAPERRRRWGQDGTIMMLHFGALDSLPGYSSLHFLLNDVFPLLSSRVLESLELLVIGDDRKSALALKVHELASRYTQVRFLGFVDAVEPYYAIGDVQLVGSLKATGVRTRIVESFALRVPVLSTVQGAEGLEGLVPGQNILVAADARSFADRIQAIVADPERLQLVSEAARLTYDSLYSRQRIAARLSGLLEEYGF